MALRIYTWARMLTQSVHIVATTQLGEPALLQSRLRISAHSAEAVLAELHRYGYVGHANMHGTRDVLITPDAAPDAVAVITASVPSPPPAITSVVTIPEATTSAAITPAARPAQPAPPGRPATGEQQHLARPASAALVARMRALQERASRGTTAHEDATNREPGGSLTPDPARLLRLHADAVACYRRNLAGITPRPMAVRNYLTRRGMPTGSDRWQIGYAPPSWDALTTELRAAGYTDQELVDAGLSVRGPRGLYDRFRDRVMIPITDADGAAIAFLGRLPTDTPAADAGPKYLNSPNTILYRKGRDLFGYGHDPTGTPDLGRGAIILVEGPIDVIAFHHAADDFEAAGRAGPQHRPIVLAACGTAITAEHINTLRALAPNREIISALDSDAAGAAATLKLAELLRDWDGPTAAARLPVGADPATVYQNGGADLLYTNLRNRRPLLDLVLDAQVQRSPELTSVEGQVLAGERIARVLVEREVGPPELERQLWRLAETYNIPHDVLILAWCEAMEKPPSRPATSPPLADQVDQRKTHRRATPEAGTGQHPPHRATPLPATPASPTARAV